MNLKLPDIMIFQKGDTITREGEPGDSAFFIVSGEVEVYKRNKSGREAMVGRLGADELIGEICLFADHPKRSATVKAFTHKVQVIELKKSDFEQELGTLSPRMQMITQAMIRRLRQVYNKIAWMS